MGIISGLGAVLTRGTRLRGDPACSFWVTTRMKEGREKVSFPCCGVERTSPPWEGWTASRLDALILQMKHQGGFGGPTPRSSP